jgi:hypothetical protein
LQSWKYSSKAIVPNDMLIELLGSLEATLEPMEKPPGAGTIRVILVNVNVSSKPEDFLCFMVSGVFSVPCF